MWIPFELTSVLLLSLCAAAYPTTEIPQVLLTLNIPLKNESVVRPLVLWHGLGDSYASAGMLEFAKLIKDVHPGIFIHSVYVEENLEKDQRAGFFGNVDVQLGGVAERIAEIDELSDGFDAIGFSQGGQFLRAYVERYNSPPVHNLLTFGSQHMGVADLPLCRPTDFLCQAARRAARAGVYSGWAQNSLVQAQYFRDPDQLPAYLATNKFLTSINNEIAETANLTYAENLSSLNKLILVLFSDDKTVVPKESAWFGSFAPPEDKECEMREKTIVPMRLQPVYLANTFGLKTLDERGGIILEVCEGQHMQIARDCWEPLVRRFVGGKLETDSTGKFAQ